MSDDQHIEGKLTSTVIIFLTVTVTSVIWIIIRTIHTITITMPALVVAASGLLSLILLGLTIALMLKKHWSLVPLSNIGKGYFLLTIILLLIRSENMLDATWLFTTICIAYLSILNYINPLRVYVSPFTYTRKVTGMFIAGRVAGGTLFVAACLTLYILFLSNLFPEYAYRIQPVDYDALMLTPDETDLPAHTWSVQWKMAIPVDLESIETVIGIGAWTDRQGEKIIVSPGVWSQQVEEYAFMGFTGPYEFDKAVWKAGMGHPFLLVLKMIMADERTRVYYYEDPGFNASVVIKHLELSTPPSWVVSANIYPTGGPPYSAEITGRSLERALLPVHMTFIKLKEES